MRRSFSILVTVLGISALLVSVGAAAAPEHGGTGEPLYLGTGAGVSVVDSSTGDATFSARDALPSGDWSLVFSARPTKNGATVVEAIEPTTGTVVRSQQFDDALSVRAVSRDGSLVALMPREPDRYGGYGLYKPVSRDTTTILLTRLVGSAAQRIDLDANVEPEAFTTDNAALFVVRFSPPLHPDRYRVSRLDLASGKLGSVYTNQKELQGNMRGNAYTQVLAPDGSRLYTFYKKNNGEAFVHVLSLDQQFANCVDLPKGFGKDPSAVAITTTPTGDGIVVYDGLGRQIVELDAAQLRVTRAERFRGLAASHFPVAATATDDSVFLARDNTVVALDRSRLRSTAEWTTKGAVQALKLGTNGLVLVAEHNRVTAIDPQQHGRGWTVKVNVGGAIHSVADTLAYTSKGSVQCAC